MGVLKRVEELESTATEVYEKLVLPHWIGKFHGMHNCLYGYMMVAFSIIDLLSGYWEGNFETRGQTKRMVEFLNKYIVNNTRPNNIAVQLWRH